MTPAFHSTTYLKVARDNNRILAETTLLSSRQEAVGWLQADIYSLQIIAAGWALYRSPRTPPGYYLLPELQGLEAFLQSGPDLRRVLREHNPLAYHLLAESIRGVVQAETFFYRERGYASARAYDEMWDSTYADTCRYYSHLEQVVKPWMEYAGSEERAHHLFHRSLAVTINQADSKNQIMAVFIDSFHEMQVQLTVDDAGRIQQAAGDYLRAPDQICRENRSHLDHLPGCKLGAVTKKDLARLAGGAEGCHHLVDLLHYAAESWRQLSGETE